MLTALCTALPEPSRLAALSLSRRPALLASCFVYNDLGPRALCAQPSTPHHPVAGAVLLAERLSAPVPLRPSPVLETSSGSASALSNDLSKRSGRTTTLSRSHRRRRLRSSQSQRLGLRPCPCRRRPSSSSFVGVQSGCAVKWMPCLVPSRRGHRYDSPCGGFIHQNGDSWSTFDAITSLVLYTPAKDLPPGVLQVLAENRGGRIIVPRFPGVDVSTLWPNSESDAPSIRASALFDDPSMKKRKKTKKKKRDKPEPASRFASVSPPPSPQPVRLLRMMEREFSEMDVTAAEQLLLVVSKNPLWGDVPGHRVGEDNTSGQSRHKPSHIYVRGMFSPS
jgi:hypothetical protein